MKIRVFTFLLILTGVQTSLAQIKTKKPVRREVIIALKYVGNYGLGDKATTTQFDDKGNKIVKANMQGDNLFWMLIPYDKNQPNNFHWPLNTYLNELHAEPYQYLYKDIFLINDINQNGIYQAFCNEYKFNKQKLIKDQPKPEDFAPGWKDNDVYLMQTQTGAVAKMWIIDALWDEYTVNDKPQFFNGLYPRTLNFEQYHIFTLRKIISLKPVIGTNNDQDNACILVKKDAALIPFEKPKGR
ncbi:hypothetical protein GCM10023149_39600 [Mucilaginibacter gynuensis]|uniref:GLPGLI family protein n=1 Tax=Mucilaginibacter gynuensis TaxID=1302236 RepID=A0ABP8H1H2_9SPHI